MNMKRKYIDCREHPNSNCSIRFSGDEKEIIPTVRQHIQTVHPNDFKASELTDDKIRSMLKDEPQSQARQPAA